MILEMNAIAGEFGRTNYLYEPEVITEIMKDGRKQSRIVVRLYVDKNDKSVYSQLEYPVFTDSVYFNVKEQYELIFDDDSGPKELTDD
mmetsp:Transcript_31758/g.48718  ORF Transcript_31758/g.48718 Transcript_31758/m.48718 type:complete len:88 (-) Transcript_31758:805-1068(-)